MMTSDPRNDAAFADVIGFGVTALSQEETLEVLEEIIKDAIELILEIQEDRF